MSVIAVTGATGAIGKAIAKLVADEGHETVLLCRDRAKSERAVEEIKRASGNDEVRYELVDLSRRSSIDELAARWSGPLHALVNNAAITPRRREETPEGIELQLATNVLGYLWTVDAFSEVLEASAPARVVNVASYWAGGLDLDDLQFERRRYDNNSAYRQSKQANRMLTVMQSERLRPRGVSVNVCHPGDTPSQLARDLGFGGHETPEQCAETPVWLATEPVGQEQSGKYFEHLRESSCRFVADRGAVERLYERCSKL